MLIFINIKIEHYNKYDFDNSTYEYYYQQMEAVQVKVLEEYEIKENSVDHRSIGTDQELFFFNELSPGSPFWLPNGTRLFGKLQSFIRDEYFKRGFDEVMSPVIAKQDLWQISGHWDKYKENMFCLACDDTEYALSSMNCPKHCLVYKNTVRSYKELPLRLADFGTLHRNEASGSLTGLTRVRAFKQDDAHVFCTQNQIKQEMKAAIEFLTYVYNIFNFKFEVALSTRPEKFIGDIEVWDKAEKELAEVLNDSGLKWSENKQDGAFYGPKIDIRLTDSIGRQHQCGTIQLDFQLPLRFELKYVDEHGEFQTPVMIHRAIYGSFERFIAILIEHYAGRWPLWINPRQIQIVPVSEKFLEYAKHVQSELRKHKFFVDVDDSDNTVPKKIRAAQIKQYNYIVVVGQKEVDAKTVNIRYRDTDDKKMMLIDQLINEVYQGIKEFK